MFMQYILHFNPIDVMHLYFAKLSKYVIMTDIMANCGGT